MQRDDNAILLDIAHAGGLVAKFMAGKDKAAFLQDELTQIALPLQHDVRKEGNTAFLDPDMDTWLRTCAPDATT